MESRLSVIVPIYNVGAYVEECIESILNQTYKDFEIILVDDGSTDGCRDICDRYKAGDSRVKVIHKDNGGLVSARKAGLSAATSEYVTYVDGDDWIDADMYARMMKEVLDNDLDALITGYCAELSKGSIKTSNEIEDGTYSGDKLTAFYTNMLSNGDFFNFGVYPAVWNKIMRRSLFIDNQMAVDERITMGEDVACVFPFLLDCSKIKVCNDIQTYHYRQTDNGTVSKKYDPKYFERVNLLYKFLIDRIQAKANSKCVALSLEKYYWFLFLLGIDRELRYDGRKKNEKIRNLTKAVDEQLLSWDLFKADYRNKYSYHKLDSVCNRKWNRVFATKFIETVKGKIIDSSRN